MIKYLLLLLAFSISQLQAQQRVTLNNFNRKNVADVKITKDQFTVSWPAGKNEKGQLVLNLDKSKALFKSLGLSSKTIVSDLDPVFLLTVGKRDLVSQNGWNIFFDRVPLKPFKSYRIAFDRQNANVSS